MLASRLLVLRSRLLLAADPAAAEAAEQAAAHEVQRLRNLQFARAAAAWLEARPQLGRDVFARPSRERDPRVASYMRLMEACLALLEREEDATLTPEQQGEQVYRPVTHRLFGMPQALARMRAKLEAGGEPALLTAFLPVVPPEIPNRDLLVRSAVSSTLAAALELARSGEALLSGSERFEGGYVAVAPPDASQAG